MKIKKLTAYLLMSGMILGTMSSDLYTIKAQAVIRQIKRCRFHQIKTGLSEHLTMG